jgi:uncharacterized RDD family membrane protein YckC
MQDQQNPYAAPQANIADVGHGGDQELASLGARLGGAIIDTIIGLVIILPVMFIGGYWSTVMEAAQAGQQPGFLYTSMWTLIGFAITVAIQFVPLNASGQTWGKKIVGTKIVNFEDGRKPDIFTLIGKRLGSMQLLNLIPFIGPLIGFVGVLLIFRENRRTLFDQIAGTRVVNAK